MSDVVKVKEIDFSNNDKGVAQFRSAPQNSSLITNSAVEDMLSYLDPDTSYDQWLKIGMGLKNHGCPLELWDTWSRGSEKYKDGECAEKWHSFSAVEDGVTIGSIIYMAREAGWVGYQNRSQNVDENYCFLNVSDFHGKPIPEMVWLADEWIPAGLTTALYGDGGVGKSLIAMQLMTSVSLGMPWLGLDVKHTNTLGFFCEDTIDELHRRQSKINRMYGCEFSDLQNMHWYSGIGLNNVLMDFVSGNGETTDVYDWLRKRVVQHQAGLLIIDTAADTFGGNENSRIHVRQFIGILNKLAHETDCTVVLCAHPSVSGLTSGAGTGGNTAWNNSVRARLYFRKLTKDETNGLPKPDFRILEKKKSNYSKSDQEIQCGWNDGVFREIDASALKQDSQDINTRIEHFFLEQLDKYTKQNISLSCKPTSSNNAAKMMMEAEGREKEFTKRALKMAMQRLLDKGVIINENYGPPSRQSQRIVRVHG